MCFVDILSLVCRMPVVVGSIVFLPITVRNNTFGQWKKTVVLTLLNSFIRIVLRARRHFSLFMECLRNIRENYDICVAHATEARTCFLVRVMLMLQNVSVANMFGRRTRCSFISVQMEL